MNALNSSPAPQREQSMEEILASIRKIIESNEAMANQAEVLHASRNVGDAPVARTAEPLKEQTPMSDAIPSAMTVAPERLVSESPEKRVAAAFDDLNLAFLRAKSVPAEANVEALLKPMLQEWLDNNLPGLVERLVREEIARIARGDI
jgi:cell pole-organizing protein PopZ